MKSDHAPAPSIPQRAAHLLGIIRLWPLVFGLFAGVSGLFLFIGADSFSSTSRAVLHGLCAQRPTHSFVVGDELLPFDARMTGIYAGSLTSWLYFVARKRTLSARTPSPPVLALLAAGIGALAIDGFNSLLLDLNRPYLYEPHNVVRFFTGFGTGVAIASLEVWLIAGTLSRMARNDPAWKSVWEVGHLLPVPVVLLVAILVSPAWAFPVVASLLMLSAWITVAVLVLVIVVSILRLERKITTPQQVEAPLLASAILALAIILGLAQLRFWLERMLGVPQDFIALSGAVSIDILAMV